MSKQSKGFKKMEGGQEMAKRHSKYSMYIEKEENKPRDPVIERTYIEKKATAKVIGYVKE